MSERQYGLQWDEGEPMLTPWRGGASFGTLADASGEKFVVTTEYPHKRTVRGSFSGLEWEW